MSDAPSSDGAPPRCGRADCPGFTEWRIVHPARRNSHTVILEGVPAFVCFKCGETVLSERTQQRIEALLDEHPLESTLPFREWKE